MWFIRMEVLDEEFNRNLAHERYVMKELRLTRVLGVGASILLLTTGFLKAQNLHTQSEAKHHTVRYKLIELTLGGPISHEPTNVDGGRALNNASIVSSYADTTLPDPFAPDLCFEEDCLVAHTFRWRNGVMTDLGSLVEGVNSSAASLNDRGWTIGASQTGIH